jgi:hypothetical protein
MRMSASTRSSAERTRPAPRRGRDLVDPQATRLARAERLVWFEGAQDELGSRLDERECHVVAGAIPQREEGLEPGDATAHDDDPEGV